MGNVDSLGSSVLTFSELILTCQMLTWLLYLIMFLCNSEVLQFYFKLQICFEQLSYEAKGTNHSHRKNSKKLSWSSVWALFLWFEKHLSCYLGSLQSCCLVVHLGLCNEVAIERELWKQLRHVFLLSYFTSQPQCSSLHSAQSFPHLPTSPDPLFLLFPSEKSSPLRDINWSWHNKLQ